MLGVTGCATLLVSATLAISFAGSAWGFLASGIALVFSIDLKILQAPWLLAKLAGLILYIGLGMVAMRFGRTPETRLVAFVGAVATFAYIVGIAYSKSPASWLAFLA